MKNEYGDTVGPNTGKKAVVYQVAMPDGTKAKKRIFNPRGDEELIATALMDKTTGRPIIAIWDGEPKWEGEFGRLKAIKLTPPPTPA